MKARLKFTALIFLVTVRFSEGLTWNTKMRSAVCCQCNKQLLIWNFTKGEHEKVTGLYWFFNEKTLVCFVSNITGFLVADLYEGRVERKGLAEIQLKNVSLNDTGEYTLYVKLEEEKERNFQGINLTVVEPPPNQCKPIIQKEHPNGIIFCFTSCERSPLSLEWIINETKDPRGIGPYFVVNSSGTSEQPICCLRDFKCIDYQTKFCTRNNISFTEDLHTVNQSLADTDHMVCILIIIIVALIALIIEVIACVILLNRRRCSLFHRHHSTRTQDMKLHGELLMQPFSEENSPMLPTDQEPHAGVNDVQVPDWRLQDSNQQNVNNIRDADFVQSIVQSNTALMAELQASREETRKLKRQLHQEKHRRKKENRHKYSLVECSDFKNNDTETCETFESEDASSDDTDTFKTSESEEASLELPSTPKLF